MTTGTRRAAIFSAMLAGATMAFSQTDLQPITAFSSNAQGYAMQPEVGKPFFVSVKYRVTGYVNRAYRIRIQTSYADLTTPDLTFGIGAPGDYQITWGPIDTLMDRSVPVTVTLDSARRVSEKNEKNNVFGFTMTPQSPQSAREAYGSQLLSGQMHFHLDFDRRSSTPQTLTIAYPVPITESFQEVVRQVTPNAAQVSDQNGQPFLLDMISQPTLEPINTQQVMITRAHSVRVNLNMLNQIGWGSVDAEARTMPEWISSETYIPLNDRNVVSFVGRNLPRNYRSMMTPAETAETLYRALLKGMRYDGRAGQAPDASQTLRSKKGDCGGLSAAYVALLRTVGIPARTVAGFTEGQNQWHVWTEFYLPNAGWIPVDPAYAKGAMPSGDAPIYFGVVPDLNARIATSFGLDRESGSFEAPLLQSTRVEWTGRNVRIGSAYTNSNLSVIESAGN
ncbi:MAG: transglutaminase domain-containing protein [Fimbriimonadaceae bacterium]|nr:transglutaminase domain-containing protein [Fimbriimonadaceae bacterium]